MAKIKPNDPCPCGSGNKYKKCCRDKKIDSVTPHPSPDYRKFDIKYLQMLQTCFNLIEKTREIGNPDKIKDLALSQNVAIKLFSHLCTLFYLSRKTSLKSFVPGCPIEFFDHSSAKVLARTAFENYLVFTGIFRKPEEKRDFLIKVWRLFDLQKAKKIPAAIPEDEEKKNIITKNIESLKKEIRSHSVFKTLTKREQDKAKQGIWLLAKTWPEVAKEEGFNFTFFDVVYDQFTKHVHTGSLSAEEVSMVKNKEDQFKHLGVALEIGLVILAHFIKAYIEVFPKSNTIKVDQDTLSTIEAYFRVGETMYENDYEGTAK